MLLNCAGPEMGLDTAPRLWQHRMLIQLRATLPPFLRGVARREGNHVTVLPKEQTVEVARGERLKTGVNKVMGIFEEGE